MWRQNRAARGQCLGDSALPARGRAAVEGGRDASAKKHERRGGVVEGAGIVGLRDQALIPSCGPAVAERSKPVVPSRRSPCHPDPP